MKTLHVTMLVGNIRSATVGRKVRIQRVGGFSVPSDFQEVLRVEEFSPSESIGSTALCRICFLGDVCVYVHHGDVIEVLEETDEFHFEA